MVHIGRYVRSRNKINVTTGKLKFYEPLANDSYLCWQFYDQPMLSFQIAKIFAGTRNESLKINNNDKN